MGRTVAIITAGGSGKRLKSKQKKQFIVLNDRPLLFWTLDKFIQHKSIDDIIIVLPESDMNFSDLVYQEFPKEKIICVSGGKERQDSVLNALRSCPPDTDTVMIHDGVRPFITGSEISKLHKYAQEHNAVIAVTRVKNTIKKVSKNKIDRTIPREDLFSALTPQVFNYTHILKFHNKAKEDKLIFTDDAAILEFYGEEIFTLECSSHNIKITDPFDLKIAEFILNNNLLGDH